MWIPTVDNFVTQVLLYVVRFSTTCDTCVESLSPFELRVLGRRPRSKFKCEYVAALVVFSTPVFHHYWNRTPLPHLGLFKFVPLVRQYKHKSV